MTTTYITTGSITTGIAHTFAADYDGLYVVQGITWGSTDSRLFDERNFEGLTVHIAGDAVQSVNSILGGDFGSVTIAETGSLTSFQTSRNQPAIEIWGSDSTITNHGNISATKSIGLLSLGGSSSIVNTGTINAASGVFLSFSGAGDSLINSGTISANSFGADGVDLRFNHAVVAFRADSTVTNLEGGVLTAISAQGAGVKLMDSAGGSIITNLGTIFSKQGLGIDLTQIISGNDTITLYNSGTIQGGGGSYGGSSSADRIENTGAMIGDVELGFGDDIMINGGIVNGDVLLEGNDDIYTALSSGVVTGLISGGIGNDTITGGDGADFIDGGDDNDRLFGRGGDDDIRGGLGSDFMSAGAGDDFVLGDNGADRIFGGGGEDTLQGGRDLDTIRGGDGDDEINGGRSADVLRGGSGADTFLYQFRQDSTLNLSDRIQDFEVGVDVIDVSATASQLSFVGSAAFSGSGNEVRYEIGGNGRTFVEVDTDANGTADMRILLGTVGALTEDDFVL